MTGWVNQRPSHEGTSSVGKIHTEDDITITLFVGDYPIKGETEKKLYHYRPELGSYLNAGTAPSLARWCIKAAGDRPDRF